MHGQQRLSVTVSILEESPTPIAFHVSHRDPLTPVAFVIEAIISKNAQ